MDGNCSQPRFWFWRVLRKGQKVGLGLHPIGTALVLTPGTALSPCRALGAPSSQQPCRGHGDALWPGSLRQLVALAQQEGPCPSVCPGSGAKGRAEEQNGPGSRGHGGPCAALTGAFEEQRSRALVCSTSAGNLEVPRAPRGMLHTRCQALENRPNLCSLQAFFSSAGGGNSHIKMETRPFCQAINSASYGNREVPAFTLNFQVYFYAQIWQSIEA